MRRDLIIVGLFWVVLTILGEILVSVMDIFPFLASEEGQLIDDAFKFLMVMAVPVFAFVVSVLVYSVLRFRHQDGVEEARPAFKRVNGIFAGWLLVTSALAVIILIYPGIAGIRELRADSPPDIEVQVIAEKWEWTFIYSDYDITIKDANELVLPVDARVRFEVTSKDVLHSFWVPAFRMKVDAVPGQFNTMYVTTMETGTFTQDANMRVQCAELCGTGHARMRTRLIVMELAEFEEWIAGQ